MTRARPDAYPPATWRLVDSGPADGATNMAVDEAIATAVAAGESPPTLRFYGWEPACLSLGFAQSADVVDFDACAAQGWDVVRRASGGRAILHTDELTYCVCAPSADPRVHGRILASYQRLSTALLAGLNTLGLEPARAQPVYKDEGALGAACFDGPAQYEITIGQRKLVGSAQKRRRGVVWQHGSLPLTGDISRIAHALAVEQPGQRPAIQMRLRYRATTLDTSLGRPVSYAEAAAALRHGFEKALNLTFESGSLSPKETARAAALRADRYASPTFTHRR